MHAESFDSVQPLGYFGAGKGALSVYRVSEPVELSFVYFPVAEGKIEGGGGSSSTCFNCHQRECM